jgi:hypothetical protein
VTRPSLSQHDWSSGSPEPAAACCPGLTSSAHHSATSAREMRAGAALVPPPTPPAAVAAVAARAKAAARAQPVPAADGGESRQGCALRIVSPVAYTAALPPSPSSSALLTHPHPGFARHDPVGPGHRTGWPRPHGSRSLAHRLSECRQQTVPLLLLRPLCSQTGRRTQPGTPAAATGEEGVGALVAAKFRALTLHSANGRTRCDGGSAAIMAASILRTNAASGDSTRTSNVNLRVAVACQWGCRVPLIKPPPPHPRPKRSLRCWMGPSARRRPPTMMPIRLQSASTSGKGIGGAGRHQGEWQAGGHNRPFRAPSRLWLVRMTAVWARRRTTSSSTSHMKRRTCGGGREGGGTGRFRPCVRFNQ